ncbi:hypothetical protein COOONC_02955 [Cooperia oncophora]
MRIGLFVLLVSFSICAALYFFEDDDGIYNEEGCGERPFGPRLRSQGGELVEKNEIPWAALLKRKEREGYCSGTLITKRHVLTAAHCFKEWKYRDTIETILETMIGSDCTRYPCKQQKFHRVKNVREFSM